MTKLSELCEEVDLTAWTLAKTERAIDKIVTSCYASDDPAIHAITNNFKVTVQELARNNPTLFTYCSKFIHPDFSVEVLEVVVKFVTIVDHIGHQMAEEIKRGSDYTYSNIEEYERAFESVPVWEIEKLWVDQIIAFNWITVETIHFFTKVSKELPDLEFDLRWLLASGEKS